jgi:hypothetical protein
MLIGTSFSKCSRDIIQGNVHVDDVLVIIAGTNFDPNNETVWGAIWRGYIHGNWRGLEDREQDLKKLAIDLYNSGKIHQPRKFSTMDVVYSRQHLPYTWFECVVRDDDMSETVKEAWNHYKFLAELS